jgi:SAM-dependent methyltransferase
LISFVCPVSGETLRNADGMLVGLTRRYLIVDGIPRFVSSDNYAQSFGLQWKEHALTQLDSRTGTSISRQRLERCLGGRVETLRGRLVLEAGCGAGRFTELMVQAGALVHAIDLSVAVEANRDNIGERLNYCVAQADIRALPFPQASFDVVVCLGVLQHTPSTEESIAVLWKMLKPGGTLVIDHYSWDLSRLTRLLLLYRAIFLRIPVERAKVITDGLVRFFFPLHYAVRNVRSLQMLLSRVSPCPVYFHAYPQLTREQHYEFTRLDTFDGLTDRYSRMRNVKQIRRVLMSLDACDVVVTRGGNGVEARATKPGQTDAMLAAGVSGPAIDR